MICKSAWTGGWRRRTTSTHDYFCKSDDRLMFPSVFVLRTDCKLPQEFLSFERLLLLPEAEWAQTAKKSKLPKPKVDKDALSIAMDVLETRLKEYPTSITVSRSGLKRLYGPSLTSEFCRRMRDS